LSINCRCITKSVAEFREAAVPKRQPVTAGFDRAVIPTIAFINKAKVGLGVNFDDMIAAMQTFLDEHFTPVWGAPACLIKASKPKRGDWAMIFLDDPDDPDAQGYHDITKNGLPLSKVFVVPTIQSGDLVSVTACHELCEMLIDPTATLWSEGPGRSLWAYEMCDAVEDETFNVDGVTMSDFVYPAYFEVFRLKKPRSAQYDHLKRLKQPFQILKNGYSIVRNGRKTYEKFGSRAKKLRFKKEDRDFHRSEFRKYGAKAATKIRRRSRGG